MLPMLCGAPIHRMLVTWCTTRRGPVPEPAMALFLGSEEKPAEVAAAAAPAPHLCYTLEDRALGVRRHRHGPRPESRLLDAHEDKLVTQPLIEQVCHLANDVRLFITRLITHSSANDATLSCLSSVTSSPVYCHVIYSLFMPHYFLFFMLKYVSLITDLQ